MTFQPTPVATSALEPVQAATVARCNALLGTPLWDYVPEDQEYPYVTVGEATETPHNVHGRFGRRVRQTLHVWDKGRHGFGPAMQIVAELTQLFDHRETDVDPLINGHRIQAIRLFDSRPMRDPDPLVRHVPVTFEWITEQEPL
ncbi:DUF3168 domain-containing protein [Nocardiopsis lucentensis]|uniref:DUF3168 domain-containing protein n=1 Tax=Nocardiopsis lucentensis TaxID=53441 RepID=UPI0003458EC4|nr:DUF3168 domain-containing protein [Nocardiopsis lucentensis]